MNSIDIINQTEYFEKVVQVNRVSKKNQGGDVRSLSVLVVVGDRKGKVGVGLGKARDVASAVRKATTYAKKRMIEVPMKGSSIPHRIFLKYGAAKIMLKPAPKGSGIIAGGAVRVVMEAAGIDDVVSKILGTKNKASNVYATMEALKKLKSVGWSVSRSAGQPDGEPEKEVKKTKVKKGGKKV